MSGYVPRHARHAEPAELPAILRGLADRIVIVPSKDQQTQRREDM